MDSGDGGCSGDVSGDRRSAARRWLSTAEALLGERDFAGAKRAAERAMELDPLAAGSGESLAVACPLLAGRDRRVGDHADHYAVLGLETPFSRRDPAAIRHQYDCLAALLRPDRNRLPGAGEAARLVADAWAVLSDPDKKTLFDSELGVAGEPAPAAFWTPCPSCCHLHLYDRDYGGQNLRCPTCSRVFRAATLPSPPPIVPGTDLYYCSWGFFPLGFPTGPGEVWKQFYPAFPGSGFNYPFQPFGSNEAAANATESPAGGWKRNTPIKATPLSINRKVVAKKRVGSNLRKKVISEAETTSVEGTAIRPVEVDGNDGDSD